MLIREVRNTSCEYVYIVIKNSIKSAYVNFTVF